MSRGFLLVEFPPMNEYRYQVPADLFFTIRADPEIEPRKLPVSHASAGPSHDMIRVCKPSPHN
jgi:hypothetical protein